MSSGLASTHSNGTALAAGETHEAAARAFGGVDVDLDLRTYDELDHAGPAALPQVLLAAGPDLATALPAAVSLLAEDGELWVELPTAAPAPAGLADALRATGLTPLRVRRVSGRPLLVLGAAAPTRSGVDAVDLLLGAATPSPEEVPAAKPARGPGRGGNQSTGKGGGKGKGQGANKGQGGPRAKAAPRPGPAAPPAAPAPPVPAARRLARLLGLDSPRRAGLLGGVAAVGLVVAVVATVVAGLVGLFLVVLLGGVAAVGVLALRAVQLLERLGSRPAPAPAPAPRAPMKGVQQRLDRIDRRLRRVGEIRRIPTRRDLRLANQAVIEQVQASQRLMGAVDLPVALPALGRFTASADLLAVLVDLLVRERPRTVVESGSGVSTLVLALAARQHGVDCRIVALEHDRRYARRTRELLEAHGVGDAAEVRLAPLERTALPDHPTPWYAADALADLTDVGLVLVDGPPEATGPFARYPMLPLLADALAPACTVVADDTRRDADRETVERWLAAMPEFELHDLELEKGALLLRRTARA